MGAYVYVRVRCPVENDFQKKIGHYDLYIDKDVDFSRQAGKEGFTISHPLLTYGDGNDNYVKITTQDNADQKIDGFEYYKWQFYVSDESKIDYLVQKLSETASNDKTVNNDSPAERSICYRPSNGFKNYSKEEHNCFAAVAGFMGYLGFDALTDIIDKAYYMRYAPQLMAQMLADGNDWQQVSI